MGGVEVKVGASAIATDSGFGMTGPNGKRTIPVEAVLGGSVMEKFAVIFDYGKRTLTFVAPDHLSTEGEPVPCRVNKKTGLVSVTAEIGGKNYNLAVDCGSAYTWIRNDVAEQWVKDHPEWKRPQEPAAFSAAGSPLQLTTTIDYLLSDYARPIVVSNCR